MKLQHKTFLIRDLEVKQDGDAWTVEGFGSTFGNVDSYGDMVMPGAFVKSLLTRKPAMLWQHNSDEPIGVWDEVRETPQGLYLKGRILPTACGNDAYTLAKGGALTGLSIGYSTKKSEHDPKTNVRKLLEVELYEVSLVTFPANEAATITGVKSAGEDIDAAVALLTQAGAACQACIDMSVPIQPDMASGILQMIQDAVALLDEPLEADDTNDPEGASKSRPQTIREFEDFLREAGKFSREDATTVALRGFKALPTQGEPDEVPEEKELREVLSLFKSFNNQIKA
ncbi:MAG: HK97 family phage prohead protease [Planctomycetes bacterium]|nr:HK97 family phage prohead protease [Planctomycetota bacterium]